MSTKLKEAVFIVLACIVVGGVSGYVFSQNGGQVAGFVHNQQETFDAGIAVNGTQRIDSNGVFYPASIVIGGGQAVSISLVATSTWNPGSVASSGASLVGTNATSTQVNIAGALPGDVCRSSLSSATSTTNISYIANVNTSNGTTTVGFINHDTAVIDFATGTLRTVCIR